MSIMACESDLLISMWARHKTARVNLLITAHYTLKHTLEWHAGPGVALRY